MNIDDSVDSHPSFFQYDCDGHRLGSHLEQPILSILLLFLFFIIYSVYIYHFVSRVQHSSQQSSWNKIYSVFTKNNNFNIIEHNWHQLSAQMNLNEPSAKKLLLAILSHCIPNSLLLSQFNYLL